MGDSTSNDGSAAPETEPLGPRGRPARTPVDHATGSSEGIGAREPLYPPRRGQSVDRFIVIEQIGAGGMSAVFSAFDTVLDRRIALKFLAVPAERTLANLFEEASLMAKLQHPNVVTVYDVGQLDRAPYIAMELVEGRTLDRWAEAKVRSTEEKVRVMAAAARGLAAAHAAGIVHRDVKPQNILVSGERALVTDFGISVRIEEGIEGHVVGTPSYMAPEQFEGRSADRRTDVFGFCATFYELLYGQRPFPGTSVEEVRERIVGGRLAPPPPGAKVPGRLHRLITAGLSVDPEQRPQSLDQVADFLVRDPGARGRRTVALAAALGVLGAAFWGAGYVRASPERQCRAGVASIDGVLAPSRREKLAGHFRAGGHADLWSATQRGLDEFLGRWRGMYQDACTAMYVERRHSSEVFDIRMDCLQSRRTELKALVQSLGEAAPGKLIEGPAAAARLSPVSECDGAGQVDRLPTEPALRKKLEEVDGLIAQAFSQGLLADQKKAAAIAETAVAKARAAGYQPLLARALLRSALLTMQIGRGAAGREGPGGALAQAAQLLEESAVVAERSRADLRRAIALRELVMVNLQRGERREAEIFSKLASAAIDRLGDPPDERAAYLLNEGWRKRIFGVGDSNADFKRSLELRQRVLPPNDPNLVPSLLGVCLDERDPGRSRYCHGKALEAARASLGADHPNVASIYINLAGVLIRTPSTRPEACELFRKAVAIYDGSIDRDKPSFLATRVDLAKCLRETGRVEEARQMYEEVLARDLPASMDRAHIRQSYGLFLSDTGKVEEGARNVKLALDERRQIHGPCHDLVVESANNLAADLVGLGRAGEALRELEQTFEACERTGARPQRLYLLYNQRGFVLQGDLKRYEEALVMHRRALAYQKETGAPERVWHNSYQGIGIALLGMRQMKEAAEALGRALELRQAEGISAEQKGDSEIALAQALAGVSRPADMPRACSLGFQALAHFRDAGASYRAQVETTRSWLGRRCRGRSSRDVF